MIEADTLDTNTSSGMFGHIRCKKIIYPFTPLGAIHAELLLQFFEHVKFRELDVFTGTKRWMIIGHFLGEVTITPETYESRSPLRDRGFPVPARSGKSAAAADCQPEKAKKSEADGCGFRHGVGRDGEIVHVEFRSGVAHRSAGIHADVDLVPW